MALIYETENFVLESHDKPEVDRQDGGHMKISPKTPVVDRTCLSPKQAIELMRFTIVAGRAMISGMGKRGVTIGRINYQDNGNWKPELHIHLYGRSPDAIIQKYGNPIIPGNQEGYIPLDPDDIKAIQKECERLFQSEEFSNKTWSMEL